MTAYVIPQFFSLYIPSTNDSSYSLIQFTNNQI